MKGLKKLSLALISLLLLASCEERGANFLFPPDRDVWKTAYNNLDTPVAKQEKGILFEDFTGVKCGNCPKAYKEIERLSGIYPNRIFPVAHHYINNFTQPKNESGYKSIYDFRSDDAARISELLETEGTLPAGVIDRKRSPNGGLTYTFDGFIEPVEAAVKETTPCNIGVQTIFKSEDQVVFKVVTYYHEETNEPQFISAYLLENDLVDYQLNVREHVADYEHQHVLRQVATENTEGDLLANSTKPGDVFVQVYTVNINKGVEGEEYDTSWNPENLSVTAFVHGKGGINVIHATDHKL